MWGLVTLRLLFRAARARTCLAPIGLIAACMSSPSLTRNALEAAAHAGAPARALECNGAPDLCDLPYDRVVFAATHNANAVVGEWSLAPLLITVPGADNQERSIERQLEDGVRGLMIDIGRSGGTIDMCHGILDYGSFRSGLRVIRRFLDANATETVTIILELRDGVTSADASEVLRAEGLAPYVYVNPPGERWPTLRALGRKMIVLSPEGASDLVMAYWQHAFENPYHYESLQAFDDAAACGVERGNGDGLFVLNHFLTPLGAMPLGLGFVANGDSVAAHVERCIAARGRAPNFVTVDWYNEGSYGGGSLFSLVSELNARRVAGPASSLPPPPGETARIERAESGRAGDLSNE